MECASCSRISEIRCPDLTLCHLHFLLGLLMAEVNWKPEFISNLAKEFSDTNKKHT
jgi:hypothetical protein